MKYLIDTHVWIWCLNSPEKLSRQARHALAKPGNEFYLSPVSVWEAAHLHKRNKLGGKAHFEDWLRRALTTPELLEAPINLAIASQAAQLRLPQPDFGDNFLAATAIVHDLTLITADTQLLDCKWLKTLPAN